MKVNQTGRFPVMPITKTITLYYFNESDEAAELTEDLEKDLLEDYFLMLSEEYDFLTSKEQVKESILANEYTFTEDGLLA
jgi:hypothetical protein